VKTVVWNRKLLRTCSSVKEMDMNFLNVVTGQ